MRSVRRGRLVDEVIEQLTGDITAGTWSVGDRLPSVEGLSEQLGVGRSTVREAIQALAHRGVLESRQGRGTFLADTGADGFARVSWLRRAEALDLYEARRGLETDAARLAASRRTTGDLAVLTAAAADRRRARRDGIVSEWAAADLALHQAVFAATHNPVLARLFDELSGAMTAVFEQHSEDVDSTVDTAEQHEALVEAIERGDPAAAVRATTGYLDACEGELRGLLTPGRS